MKMHEIGCTGIDASGNHYDCPYETTYAEKDAMVRCLNPLANAYIPYVRTRPKVHKFKWYGIEESIVTTVSERNVTRFIYSGVPAQIGAFEKDASEILVKGIENWLEVRRFAGFGMATARLRTFH